MHLEDIREQFLTEVQKKKNEMTYSTPCDMLQEEKNLKKFKTKMLMADR